jgi:hypothetical protein
VLLCVNYVKNVKVGVIHLKKLETNKFNLRICKMAIQTLYRAGDGSIHESKAKAIEADAIVDLSKAIDKLIQENNPNTTSEYTYPFRLNIIAYINSQKDGADVVSLMDKFCARHNKHYKKQMPKDDFSELGWEALSYLRKMAKFCLENNHVIDIKDELHEQWFKELVSFSGAILDGEL